MSNENLQQEKTPVTKPSKAKVWRRRGLELLIFIIIIAGVKIWQQRNVVTGVAPQLSGVLLDGKPYIIAKPSQPVLVHFWATWCPTCRAEQGTIESLAQDKVNVVSVAMWSGKNTEVQQYVQEHGISFPVINDTDSQNAAKWGVQGVPANFIIDTKGNIRFVSTGYSTGIGLRLRMWLASL
jgi:thiol-disulfide isomerase/thioredoxin